MSKYLCPDWQTLTPYTPGEQPKVTLTKLNTNEFPYPPSPAVEALLREDSEALTAILRLYPDPTYAKLSAALATTYSIGEATQGQGRFFVGRGSDEVLATIFMAYGQGKRVYYPDITYSFYPVYSQVYRCDAVEIPLADDFSINPADYVKNDGMVIIANPNAPTGLALTLDQVEVIVRQNPDQVVVIDEAYVDFGAQSAMALVDRYDNLVVVQTLSKSRALAGLRVGFACAHPALIDDMQRLQFSRNPYPVDRLSEQIATLSLLDQEYFEQTRRRIIKSREKVQDALRELGWHCTESKSNFIFAQPQDPSRDKAQQIMQKLREKNILVRYFDKPKLNTYLRVTIGSEEEMDRFLQEIREMEASDVSTGTNA